MGVARRGAPGTAPGASVVALATGIVVTLLLGLVGAGVGVRDRPAGGPGGSGAAFAPSAAQEPGGEAVAGIDLAALVAKVDPSVVDIAATLGYQNVTSTGTGMVLTSTGQVLTNTHVIEGATTLTAQLNGREGVYDLEVLGSDATHDVALVQLIDAPELTPVELGDPAEVSVGDEVVGIGNALGRGGPPSVAPGFVTALDQSVTAGDPATGLAEQLTGLIEVDATLRPGDSGGPLVNAAGQVIGLDTAALVVARRGSSSDAGFAIPIDDALAIVDQIRSGVPTDTVTIGQPAYMGIQAQFVGPSAGPDGRTPAGTGALITVLVPDAPADDAGMEVGDAIVSVDGKRFDSPSTLTSILRDHDPGDTVAVRWIDTSGRHRRADVRLEAGPV